MIARHAAWLAALPVLAFGCAADLDTTCGGLCVEPDAAAGHVDGGLTDATRRSDAPASNPPHEGGGPVDVTVPVDEAGGQDATEPGEDGGDGGYVDAGWVDAEYYDGGYGDGGADAGGDDGGGSACSPTCGLAQPCSGDDDCASENCLGTGTCGPAKCSPSCPPQHACDMATDCASMVCKNYTCAPPACSPKCAVGSPCGANGDCKNNKCQAGHCT